MPFPRATEQGAKGWRTRVSLLKRILGLSGGAGATSDPASDSLSEIAAKLSQLEPETAHYIAGFAFVLLARRQRDLTHQHAWAVALGTWLVSYPINVLLFGLPKLTWALGLIPLTIALYVGVAIGRRLESSESGPAG